MFFISGVVALIYEAAWQREFTLLFGSSAPATAAVLAAYFAGMGLGAFILGRFVSRTRRPLIVYAVLEVLVAVGALLVTPILNLYASQYENLFARFHGTNLFFLIKAALAFLSIAIPTFAMGGTLPVLAQLFERDRARFGQLAGWLYVLNTAGAALGVLLFPPWLAAFGMTRGTQFCVCINLALAATAYFLSRKVTLKHTATLQSALTPLNRVILRRCLFIAFVSGFITFALQVGWNRAFAQIHENSIHSFAVLVALFIAAIAFGAQLSRFLLRSGWSWQQILGRSWLAAGFFLLFVPHLFVFLTGELKFVASVHLLANPRLLAPAIVMLLPVVLIAVSLPTVLHAAANNSPRNAGQIAGNVVSANIIGSVIGALVAGFVFPAALGLWKSFLACSVIVFIVAVPLLFQNLKLRLRAVIPYLLLAFVTFSQELPKARLEAARGEKLLAVREGPHGITAVVERENSRRLKQNNHYTLGGTAAIGDERLQGHLPLILHPRANKVAFLGYGTGITASSVFFHNITNAVALELVPEIADLAGEFFSQPNANFARHHPVVIEDARNFLRGTTATFDVIVGDLVVPWRNGEGALYTLEHFQAVKSALSSNGLFCCWIPMFQLGREDFEIILRTFLSVFPEAQVWRGDFSPREPALALMYGRAVAQDFSKKMNPDSANSHLQFPGAFWMHYVGMVTNISGGPLNREDRPIIELRSRRPQPFIGRDLAAWEKEVRLRTAARTPSLAEDHRAGMLAGEFMREFTILISEGRRAEALNMAERIRATVGETTANAVLGP